MAGGSDDERLAVSGAEFGGGRGDIVEAEVDHDVAPRDDGRKVIALVHLADDFDFWNTGSARRKRLAHLAFGAVDDDFRHRPENCRTATFRQSLGCAIRMTNDE